MKAKWICPDCGIEWEVDLEKHLAEMERRIKKHLKLGSMSPEIAEKVKAINDISRLKKMLKTEGHISGLCEGCGLDHFRRLLKEECNYPAG